MTTSVAGLGAWPGTDVLEAQTVVMGSLTSTPAGVDGLPFLVQLPGRGYGAEPTGRSTALLVEMHGEIGPHGWKLADRPGRDSVRAEALLREDLGALAVAGYGYAGPLVVSVTGPLSLAASLYLARGDRVLSDLGAVQALTESLAAGVVAHLDAVRAALPGAEPIVVLDESALPEVLLGRIATFSGNSVLRAVPSPVASEHLRTVAEAARKAGASRVMVHTGASWVPVRTVVAAGADAVGLCGALFNDTGWERIAEAVERGVGLWAGLPAAEPLASSSRTGGPDVVGQASALLTPWARIGLPPGGLREIVLFPEPAGWESPAAASVALADVARAAEVIAERAEEG